MSEEIAIAPQRFLPILSVTEAVQRRQAIVEFVREVMRPDVDFGIIPGTVKPTLLKPGAEKLCTLFGLTTRFHIVSALEDWSGERYDGEPFFYYHYRCSLWRDSHCIAEGDGSCNSRETRYRYREAQRSCPQCGKAAIVKGRAEYGGGWLCFVKKGGCGAKFGDGDAGIETQPVGRILNPEIADQVNTIQKMSQKRALIAATLLAVNASEFFTQDEEQRVIETEFTPGVPDLAKAEGSPARSAVAGKQGGDTSKPATAPDANVRPVLTVMQDVSTPVTPLTAAEARNGFEAKAQRLSGLQNRSELARLAVLLLGEKPERWTAQVWQTATDKAESDWQAAMIALANDASVASQALAA